MDEAIERLRAKLADLESQIRFDQAPYPEGLTGFPGILTGQGFFPGGDGLWRDSPLDPPSNNYPVNGIMVLGNDFGCLDNPNNSRSPGFRQWLNMGYENPPTWKIKETFRKAGLPPEQCFFTNAYLVCEPEPSAQAHPQA